MPTIRTKRTVTIISETPFNEVYYPDCKTVEEAIEYEKSQPLSTMLEDFAAELDSTPESKVEFHQEFEVIG